MTWRGAFLRQAVFEGRMWKKLNREQSAPWARLHFLQMLTEKLAKGFLKAEDSTEPPAHTHAQFVVFLQTIKTNAYFKRRLGFKDTKTFKAYIKSLLRLAQKIEDLAPSIAGDFSPNAEYPWFDRTTNQIHVPAEFLFDEFDFKSRQMIKLVQFIECLLLLAE